MLSPCVLNDRIQVHFQKHNTAFTVSEFQCLTETTNMSSQETCWKLWTSLGQKGIPDGNKKYTIKAFIRNLCIDQGLLSATQARKQGGRGGQGQTWFCIPQWHRNPAGHSFSTENRDMSPAPQSRRRLCTRPSAFFFKRKLTLHPGCVRGDYSPQTTTQHFLLALTVNYAHSWVKHTGAQG